MNLAYNTVPRVLIDIFWAVKVEVVAIDDP